MYSCLLKNYYMWLSNFLRAVRQPHASAQLLLADSHTCLCMTCRMTCNATYMAYSMTCPVHLPHHHNLTHDSNMQCAATSSLQLTAALLTYFVTHLKTCKAAETAYGILPNVVSAAVYLDCLYCPPCRHQIRNSTSYCGLMWCSCAG